MLATGRSCRIATNAFLQMHGLPPAVLLKAEHEEFDNQAEAATEGYIDGLWACVHAQLLI